MFRGNELGVATSQIQVMSQTFPFRGSKLCLSYLLFSLGGYFTLQFKAQKDEVI